MEPNYNLIRAQLNSRKLPKRKLSPNEDEDSKKLIANLLKVQEFGFDKLGLGKYKIGKTMRDISITSVSEILKMIGTKKATPGMTHFHASARTKFFT
jgi:hypothetical protein